jgi:hypothetical protein
MRTNSAKVESTPNIGGRLPASIADSVIASGSEAIQRRKHGNWIASSLSLLAMTEGLAGS